MKLFKQLLLLSICSISSHLYATTTCHDMHETSREQLQSIKQSLESSVTRETYIHSVKKRFSTIESLLSTTHQCNHAANKHHVYWQQLHQALTQLNSSAQTNAFNDFNNWVSSRKDDLQALSHQTLVSASK